VLLDWATVVGRTSWTLSIQLIVGCALLCFGRVLVRVLRRAGDDPARRRRRADRRRAAAQLAVAAPPAAGVALVCGLAGWSLTGHVWPLDPVSAIAPGLETLLGARATASAYLVLRAGALEGAGRRTPALRLVRQTGRAMFFAVGLFLCLLVTSILFSAPTLQTIVARGSSSVGALIAGTAALGAGGLGGLLAGLSGKPRPSGYVAVALYVSGWVLLVAAADPR
jgi:hypothetical protein